MSNHTTFDIGGVEHVMIDYKTFQELNKESLMLHCIVSTGISDWEGYDLAIDMYSDLEDTLNG